MMNFISNPWFLMFQHNFLRIEHNGCILVASLNLKGELPYELGNLSKLMVLNLSNNEITGIIPDEFNALSNLCKLHDLFYSNYVPYVVQD